MINFDIGIDSWIIQDGNYEDFEVGKPYPFALEFYPRSIQKSNGEKNCVLLERSDYEINAEIIYLDRRSWVIDFGVCAYQSMRPPRGYKVGDMISGNIYLGIDHYAYFENLKYLKDYPKIIYNWMVNEIVLDTTPFIETSEKHFERDKSRPSSRRISRTDAWNDAKGSGSYILSCTLQST